MNVDCLGIGVAVVMAVHGVMSGGELTQQRVFGALGLVKSRRPSTRPPGLSPSVAAYFKKSLYAIAAT